MKVGVTGHQDLGSSTDAAWVRTTLMELVTSSEITAGATSLAIGTDQLFAALLTEVGKPYTAIIPCKHYERAFSRPGDAHMYQQLLHGAHGQITLPFNEPSEQAFWAAGKKVVDTTESMIAVWDGQPAKGLGGTADVVRYARANGKQVLHIDPVARTVATL